MTNSHESGKDLKVDSQGNIFIIGHARNPEYDIVVWKLNSKGQIDGAGNILLAGASEGNTSFDNDATIWKYDTKGQLDQSLGSDTNPVDRVPDGFTFHHNASGHDQTDQAESLGLGPEGKVFSSGFSVSPSEGAQMVIWKHI